MKYGTSCVTCASTIVCTPWAPYSHGHLLSSGQLARLLMARGPAWLVRCALPTTRRRNSFWAKPPTRRDATPFATCLPTNQHRRDKPKTMHLVCLECVTTTPAPAVASAGYESHAWAYRHSGQCVTNAPYRQGIGVTEKQAPGISPHKTVRDTSLYRRRQGYETSPYNRYHAGNAKCNVPRRARGRIS